MPTTANVLSEQCAEISALAETREDAETRVAQYQADGLTADEIRKREDMPIVGHVADHGDVIAEGIKNGELIVDEPYRSAFAKFNNIADFSAEPIIPLSDDELYKASLDAYDLWRKPMVEVLKNGLLFYNSIYPLDEALLHVFEYLCKRRDALKPKEA